MRKCQKRPVVWQKGPTNTSISEVCASVSRSLLPYNRSLLPYNRSLLTEIYVQIQVPLFSLADLRYAYVSKETYS